MASVAASSWQGWAHLCRADVRRYEPHRLQLGQRFRKQPPEGHDIELRAVVPEIGCDGPQRCHPRHHEGRYTIIVAMKTQTRWQVGESQVKDQCSPWAEL